MSRVEADDLMLAYDRAAAAYRLAVRIDAGPDSILIAFTRWNEAREALVEKLCGEREAA